MLIDSLIDATVNVGWISIPKSFVLCIIFSINRKIRIKEIIRTYLFVTYINFVLWMTIFSRPIGIYPKKITFFVYLLKYDWYSLLQVIQNISLMIPFGMFMRKYMVTIFVIGLTLCFSVFIEITQLITRCGTFQVDDIIFNTIGGAVGCLVYSLIYLHSKNDEHTFERN